jgi:predicted NBD/HSP70 family sugar kinase
MRAWIGKPIIADLKRLTGAHDIVLKNDADMAALGEAVHGAGKAYEHVAYLTISTGVGGGLVQRKRLFEGRYSVEPGHQFVDAKTRQTLEQSLGGTHLRARYGKAPKELGAEVYQELAVVLAGGIHNLIQSWVPDVVVLGGSQTKDIPLDVVRETVASMNVMFPYVPDIVPAELGSINGLFGALAYARQLAGEVE